METHFIIENNVFFIDSFRGISNLVVEKKIDFQHYDKILNLLLDYFKPIKENRTIYDVDAAIEYLSEIYTLKDFETLEKKDIESESKKIKENMEKYLDQNEDKIIKLFETPIAEEMVSYWIMNFDNILHNFNEALIFFYSYKKTLLRHSNRAKNFMREKFFNFLKALFLAIFRIVEQIFMIRNREPFDKEKEIDLLIGDVIYLTNMRRKLGEFHY